MNDEEKARHYLKLLHDSRPKNFVREMDAQSRGLHMILHFLARSTGDVCAGDLSKQFGVSTARIAVALKKLSGKGLIETTSSASDGRRVVVKITEAGRAEVNKGVEGMVCLIKFLMQGIGEDDLNEFLRIFAKINALLDELPKGKGTC